MRHRIPYISIATQFTELASKLAVHVGGSAGLIEATNIAGVLVRCR